MRWRLPPELIRQTTKLVALLRSHPGAVLLACAAVAVIAFAFAEYRLLAPGSPMWWHWYDQKKYLDSAQAFAAGDLAPESHYYPTGYALLAAPFTAVMRADPFAVIDVLCLVGSLWAFVRLCEALGISRAVGAAIFLATSVFSYSILLDYVIPWTSTPTVFLILSGLALGFSPPTYTRAFLLGLIPGLIAMIKPADAIALAPLAVYYAVQCVRARPAGEMAQWKHALLLIGLGAAGLAASLSVAAATHWLIYGWQLSDYERDTASGPVFIIRTLPIKLYSLFVDPELIYGQYLQTQGIFNRYPWVFAGTCGMLLMLFRDLRFAVLAICTAVYTAMYATYYDLIPNGLWYYNNIHYFTWCFPIFGLFTFVLACRLLGKPAVLDMVIVIAASVLLLGWRPVLQPVHATGAFESATAAHLHLANDVTPFVIDLDGRIRDAEQIYKSEVKVHWGDRDLAPLRDSRMLPTLRGVRVLFLGPGNGRDLTIAWQGIELTNVTRVIPYRLEWTFL